jgi:hypothetical protein
MAKMAPIDLRVLAVQGAQAQIGFRRRPRPTAGDDIAEVVRPAGIAAFPHHRIKPALGVYSTDLADWTGMHFLARRPRSITR